MPLLPAIRSRPDRFGADLAFRGGASQATRPQEWQQANRHQHPDVGTRLHQHQPRYRFGRVAYSEEQARRSSVDFLAEPSGSKYIASGGPPECATIVVTPEASPAAIAFGGDRG